MNELDLIVRPTEHDSGDEDPGHDVVWMKIFIVKSLGDLLRKASKQNPLSLSISYPDATVITLECEIGTNIE